MSKDVAIDSNKGEAFVFENATHELAKIPQKLHTIHSLIPC
jgi:hypothetical protein